METRGKSINLYLIDGNPGGLVKCTLSNWTGVAYRIPRTELDKCKGRDELSQTGVYFLFGSSEESGENAVYIGQAGVRKNSEGLLYRLQEHKRNPDKDYWTDAVVFTTSNNTFGPTEISYLENRFCNIATDAKRYLVMNRNDPNSGNITEEKKSELEEFVDYAKIVMEVLGHKVFEPVLRNPATQPSSDRIGTEESTVFHITRSGINATARLTSEGIVVLSGSTIRKDLTPSCPDLARAAREENKEYIDDNNVLLKEILFKTPSGAASFVLGASANGTVEWKTAGGKTLKEIETAE